MGMSICSFSYQPFSRFTYLRLGLLKVVFCYHDPLQVGENYSHLFNLRPNVEGVLVDVVQMSYKCFVFAG